jgi:hypothetical protein
MRHFAGGRFIHADAADASDLSKMDCDGPKSVQFAPTLPLRGATSRKDPLIYKGKLVEPIEFELPDDQALIQTKRSAAMGQVLWFLLRHRKGRKATHELWSDIVYSCYKVTVVSLAARVCTLLVRPIFIEGSSAGEEVRNRPERPTTKECWPVNRALGAASEDQERDRRAREAGRARLRRGGDGFRRAWCTIRRVVPWLP